MTTGQDYETIAAEMHRIWASQDQDTIDWLRGEMSDTAYKTLVEMNRKRSRELQTAAKGKGPPLPPLKWRERPEDVTYRPHPLAEIFLPLEGPQFGELCNDIVEHGLLQPIVVSGDLILDGRNRLRACRERGIPPIFVEFESLGRTCSVEEYIWSMNIHRRHLTSDQRAAIATTWKERLATEAKQRQSAAGGAKPQQEPLAVKSPQSPEVVTIREVRKDAESQICMERPDQLRRDAGGRRAPTTRQTMAKQADVSEHKIKMAAKIASTRLDLVTEVAKGKMKLSQATRIAQAQVLLPTKNYAEAAEQDMQRFGGIVKSRLSALSPKSHRSYLTRLQAELDRFFKRMSE